MTGWGWITPLWGALLVFVALGLLSGASWARWLAIVGVALNAIQQIMFMANYPQAYPLWNILIVALNIVVLFALTARWQGYKGTMRRSRPEQRPGAAPAVGGSFRRLTGRPPRPLRDLDRNLERACNVARRGCDARGSDDRCDRRKDAAHLLGVDAHLACDGEVHQIRDRRRIDRDKRRDAYERKGLGSRLDASIESVVMLASRSITGVSLVDSAMVLLSSVF